MARMGQLSSQIPPDTGPEAAEDSRGASAAHPPAAFAQSPGQRVHGKKKSRAHKRASDRVDGLQRDEEAADERVRTPDKKRTPKLKTYSAKKRRSAGQEEPDATQPEVADAKHSKKRKRNSKQSGPALADRTGTGAEAEIDMTKNATGAREGPAIAREERAVVGAEQDSDEQATTPPAIEQIPADAKVSTWLDKHPQKPDGHYNHNNRHVAGLRNGDNDSYAQALRSAKDASEDRNANGNDHDGNEEEQEEQGSEEHEESEQGEEQHAEVQEQQQEQEDDEEDQVEDEEHGEQDMQAKEEQNNSEDDDSDYHHDEEDAARQRTPKVKAPRKRKRASSATVDADADAGRDRDAATTTAASVKRQRTSNATPTARSAAGNDFPTSGPFTPAEIECIEAAYHDRRHDLGLSEFAMNEKIQASHKDVGPLYTIIVNDVLPSRCRKAVQRFCRRHFNNFQRGKWTTEQDDMLRDAQAERPNKWVWIGGRVGRMPEDCRDRWRNHLAHADSRNTDVWTMDEELNLVQAISDCIDKLREKGKDIPREKEDENISWPMVVQRMGGIRNRLQCAAKWKKLKARTDRQEREQESRRAKGLPELTPGADWEENSEAEDESKQKKAAKKKHKTLKVGDKYEMLQEIQKGCFVGNFEEKKIFWRVVTRVNPGSPWNNADRKLVFNKLKPHVTFTGDFGSTIQEMIWHMERNTGAEELMERSHDGHYASTPTARMLTRKPPKVYTSAERVQESEDEADAEAPAGVKQNGRDSRGDQDFIGYDKHSQEDEEDANDNVEAASSELGGAASEDLHSASDDDEQRTPTASAAAAPAPGAAPGSPHISESEYSNEG